MWKQDTAVFDSAFLPKFREVLTQQPYDRASMALEQLWVKDMFKVPTQ